MKVLIVRAQQRGGVRHYYEAVEKQLNCRYRTVFVGRRTGEWGLFAPLRILYDLLMFVRTLLIFRPNSVLLNPSLNPKSIIRESVYLLFLKLYTGRVIVFFHGWERSVARRIQTHYLSLFRAFFQRADVFLVLAREFKRSLREMGFEQPVHVETTVVDETNVNVREIQRRRQEREREDPFRVLYLSRLVIEKGLLDLVEACSHCCEEMDLPVHLDIAGTGEDQEEIFEKLNQYDDSLYTYHGYVTGEPKKNLFQDSDMFALPTYFGEGLPIAVLEAMAYGLPVIVTQKAGLSEQVVDGENGIVVEPRNPEDVARAIQQLYEQRSLYDDISQHNVQYARERFWSTSVAARLEEICGT